MSQIEDWQEKKIYEEGQRSPCPYCVRKEYCQTPCFVFQAYLEGAVFNPRVVKTLIKD